MSEFAKTAPEKNFSARPRSSAPGAQPKFYVYMVRCSDSTLYTGYTTEPERRLSEHNRGVGARYTRSRLPVKLVFLMRLTSRSVALKQEARIKRMDKRRKLLLCEKYMRGEELS